MLIIEYDVHDDGKCEVVAVIEAEEQDGLDPTGDKWMEWRRSFEDGGFGCVVVADADEALIDATDDEEEIFAIVERIVLADRSVKEAGVE